MKKKHIILIIIIILIISALMQIEYRTFKGMTIEEVFEQKYSSIGEYDEIGDYYFIASSSKKTNNAISFDIAHKREDGRFVFFLSNNYSRIFKFRTIKIRAQNIDDDLEILKNNNEYIIYMARASFEDDLIIYDNINEWKEIENESGTTFYHTVVSNIDEDYTIYFKEMNKTYIFEKGKEILGKFD